MTSGDNQDQNFSVTVPVGAAVAAILLAGATAAAYLIIGRHPDEAGEMVGEARKGGRGFMRKMGLLGLIAMIENDATRKVVVAVLKAMAKRS